MYKSIFANAAAIIVVALLDAVFVRSLPFALFHLHIFFLAIVFVLLFSNLRLAAWWTLGGALVLEVFSFSFFGSYLIIAFFVLLVAHFLFEKVMTNRSVFSVMVVTASVTVLADLLFLALDFWSTRVIQGFGYLSVAFIESIVVNVIAAIVFFYVANTATRRLKPVFLPFIRKW